MSILSAPTRSLILRAPYTRDPLWRIAQQVPAFDIDFTRQTITDRIGGITPTFTRAGSEKLAFNGSVFASYGADVPAFRLGAGGVFECQLEPAATNVVSRNSETTAGWISANLTATAVSAVGVIGPGIYYSVKEAAFNSEHFFQRDIGQAGATGPWAHSCIVRPTGGLRYAWLRPISTGDNGTASSLVLDFQLGTASVSGAAATNKMINLGNGWWDVGVVITLGGANTTNLWRIHTRSPTNTNTYLGDPSVGIDVYLPQVEAGPNFTSPIITAGTNVIRASDNLSITGNAALTALLRSGDLTVYSEHVAQGWTGGNQFIYSIDNSSLGAGFEEIRAFEGASGGITMTHSNNNAQQTVQPFGTGSPGSVSRYVYAAGVNNSTGATNRGARPADDTVCINPSNMDRVVIGSRAFGIFRHNLAMRRFCIFPGRIPNARLDAMVAG